MAENDKSKAKKQVPLRLSASLYDELARWAEEDFRSINGQIEFLLTECVKKRRKSSKKRQEEYEYEKEMENLKAVFEQIDREVAEQMETEE